MTRHIIVEGVDRVGKDTFIDKLRRELTDTVVMVHNGPPPRGIEDPNLKSAAMVQTYAEQTKAFSRFDGTVIWNRLHLSSTVYDHTLRGLPYEKQIFERVEDCIALDRDDVFIIVLTHPAIYLVPIDDGESTWTRQDPVDAAVAIQTEQRMFKECLFWSRYPGAVIDPRRDNAVLSCLLAMMRHRGESLGLTEDTIGRITDAERHAREDKLESLRAAYIASMNEGDPTATRELQKEIERLQTSRDTSPPWRLE